MNQNIANWEDIYKHRKPGSHLLYPSEHLVTFFFRHRALIDTRGKCLDFGFGSGNNAEFLLDQMAEYYGIEVSASALEIARHRLVEKENFKPDNLRLATETTLLGADSFDLVVAWQVLCYNDEASLQKSIFDLYRMMRQGGILIATLTTPRDSRNAARIGTNTYRIEGRMPDQEGCVIYSPETEESFRSLFSRFHVVDCGYYERASWVDQSMLSEYYFVGQKR